MGQAGLGFPYLSVRCARSRFDCVAAERVRDSATRAPGFPLGLTGLKRDAAGWTSPHAWAGAGRAQSRSVEAGLH